MSKSRIFTFEMPGMIRAAIVAIMVAMTFPASVFAQDLVVRAGTLHTGVGDAIIDGVVVIEDGLVRDVGPASRVAIPEGVEVIRQNR